MIVNDASWIVIDDSRVMIQIEMSLTDNSGGIIYSGNSTGCKCLRVRLEHSHEVVQLKVLHLSKA